ncbi:hypothetical protein FSP39_024703 [Pinctada imbricata]|uniref:G-protein coupled receptors family 1 profile domain-containing protein n=1 Tax=Pinctada imbricata TaxID=66713 RepID=A0AA88XXG6_PINIB|nr:hypothetical protein FSP39_024703 [Pinctada imbricata]
MASNYTRNTFSGPQCVPGQRYEIDMQRYEKLVQIAKLIDNPPPKSLPDWELALKVLFYIPPFCIDVIGNIMVILIVILNKRMRTTTNVLIVNLSVADISVAIFCMWIHVGVEFTRDWHFGPFFCRFHLFIKVVAVTSSVLTMTIISVERFMAIVFPLRGKIKIKVAIFAIVVSWLLSVGTASPYLFVMRQESLQFKNRRKIECVEKWPEYYNSSCGRVMPHRKLYYTLAVTVMYVVPVIIMAVTYTIIVIKLIFKKVPGGGRNSEAHERRKRKLSSSNTM